MTEQEPSADLRSHSKAKRARKASAKFAAMAGTTPRMVEMAKTVKRYGPPELSDRIAAGQISLSAAYQETRRLIIWARGLGVDVDPKCRIGGRAEPRNTQPCPDCAGTGRVPLDDIRQAADQPIREGDPT